MRKDPTSFDAQVKGLVAKSRCVFQTPARAPDDRELRINFHIEENDFRWCRDHLPEGFKVPAPPGAAATMDEYDWEPDEDEVSDEEVEEVGPVDADGLCASDQAVIREVCEMGFDRAAVVRNAL